MRITQEIATRILDLRKQGLFIRQIAKQVGCSFSSIESVMYGRWKPRRRPQFKRIDFSSLTNGPVEVHVIPSTAEMHGALERGARRCPDTEVIQPEYHPSRIKQVMPVPYRPELYKQVKDDGPRWCDPLPENLLAVVNPVRRGGSGTYRTL
jgi:hypothetical protein